MLSGVKFISRKKREESKTESSFQKKQSTSKKDRSSFNSSEDLSNYNLHHDNEELSFEDNLEHTSDADLESEVHNESKPNVSTRVNNYSAAEQIKMKLKKSLVDPKLYTSYSNETYINDNEVNDGDDVDSSYRKVVLAQKRSQLLSRAGDGKEETLASLVLAERLNNKDTMMDKLYHQSLLKSSAKRPSSSGADEEDEDIATLVTSNKLKREKADEVGLNQEMHSIARKNESSKMRRAACRYCAVSDQHHHSPRSYAVVAKSTHALLLAKETHLRLSKGHSEIIPVSHSSGLSQCDAETLKAVELYKSSMNRIFQSDGKIALVIECSHIGSQHTRIDVVPMDANLLDEAIIYFKEAFLSRQHEGRLIELTLDRGLLRAVPKGFKYLCVEWGSRKSSTTSNRIISQNCIGLVFVFERESEAEFESVDDSSAEKASFYCLDIIAGLLDKDPCRSRRRLAEKDEIKAVQEHVIKMKAKWNEFT